jgi:hypothetical protein
MALLVFPAVTSQLQAPPQSRVKNQGRTPCSWMFEDLLVGGLLDCCGWSCLN